MIEMNSADSDLPELDDSAPSISLDDPAYYINRELSHLAFNQRVLEQALEESHPILERLKFLLIFSSNLDEFFEIRVAGLMQSIKFERETAGLDGAHPKETLREISRICHETVEKQYEILNNILFPALEKEDIRFLRRSEWSDEQSAWVNNFIETEVLPIISPIGLDPAHPFPRLVNKSLNFIVELEGKDAFGRDLNYAIVPAPRTLPRIIKLPEDLGNPGHNFIFLSSMIHAHADQLFPGMEVKGCYQFRLTRNADLDVDVEGIADLARALRGELHSRRFGTAVRLEVADNCPSELTDFLLKETGLTEDDLYRVDGPVNLKRLMRVPSMVGRTDLLYPPFTPSMPKGMSRKDNIFDAIARKDYLLLHPFESYAPVVQLLRQAAKDPNVVAIKQTLYRTGNLSSVVDALIDAARNGKEVTAVVELRARFDEEENLELASRLQEAGAVVVYGVVGYKTHAKMILIVRRDGTELKRYVHLGTGNYHSGNARLYTDYSLLTADPVMGADVHRVFQQLTGMGKTERMDKLLHAPFTLKRQLLRLIDREVQAQREGKQGRIILKCNGLTEPKTLQALYKASQEGVQIDLIIRGMCCLRPGIPGVSENIRVHSIIGRFLEHTRVYYFANAEYNVYCASADLMERNLNRRVETCFPICQPELAQRVLTELELYINDTNQRWELDKEGVYTRVEAEESRAAQAELLQKLAN
ncbi:polyphosphate kinase 1 [Saccharophagus degradans]|uniref:Polyphosphate kinase n=1 Tax=Saccharophagus degradans TaxID=86304 RepID=A0AAW7X6R9_9GAMM|nr:polyphosphate kinase 1 [Saccharophagus degradans]MBU2985041.1 polyphosphate kinase 1 [Saccharophagus degradans]MDO6423540.1 polyphosphate kinase 1 [Saccharophagus degradans]MDO6607788.1 polyphosphate kinase 1 [Saccharophagus degradans]